MWVGGLPLEGSCQPSTLSLPTPSAAGLDAGAGAAPGSAWVERPVSQCLSATSHNGNALLSGFTIHFVNGFQARGERTGLCAGGCSLRELFEVQELARCGTRLLVTLQKYPHRNVWNGAHACLTQCILYPAHNTSLAARSNVLPYTISSA